ncbi:MAG TPA: hypothetical protein VF950_29120 [Planctomycetota bacterium]
MPLDDLAPDRQLTLCLKAGEFCLRRILEIERKSDPADTALHRLLREIESWERAQLDQVAEIGRPAGLQDPETAVDPYFPSARERLGEAPLNRDSAMYYVENLKEEASRFFQEMARAAMDERSRAIFTHIALGGLGQIARLRTVLL